MNRELAQLQRLLWGDGRRSVLLVLQAMDTGGKDGTIRKVFSGVNPQGVDVHGFGVPGPHEAEHDYLWRVHLRTPAKGRIAVFNRSHYEDVLVVRVNDLVSSDVWSKRYRHIREFERMLDDEGTTVRDLGAPGGEAIALAAEVARGEFPGPEILPAGHLLCVTGGHGAFVGRAVSEAEGFAAAARTEMDAGARWLKLAVTGGMMTPGVDPNEQQMPSPHILAAVQAGCCHGGRDVHWAVFLERTVTPLLKSTKPPSLSTLCEKYHIPDEAKASNMIITVKRRFQAELVRHVRLAVGSDADVQQEICDLLKILSNHGAG